MNDSLVRFLFLAQVASTLYMLGVIWIVQVVHYPLFASVGVEQFERYEQQHAKLITSIIAVPMLIEAATALLLLLFSPSGIARWPLWIGAALLGLIWLSTAFVQVPCHNLLARGFDQKVHDRLVSTNWLRTVAWSIRGILVLWMTWTALSQTSGALNVVV